jgi:hypothetical protein
MEEQENRPACRAYEGRLESLLLAHIDAANNGCDSQDPELAAHLKQCAGCRGALERAREAGEWVRATQPPAPDPGNWFATRVMARIREEERKRAATRIWAPIESLASRLALGVGMVLLVLGTYVYESSPQQLPMTNTQQSELTSEFPQPPAHPADKDEVLASLSGENYGY